MTENANPENPPAVPGRRYKLCEWLIDGLASAP
jgi:hypothetical protein